MDFLKSTFASAISKGPPFPYTFRDSISVSTSPPTIWTVHNGTQHSTNTPCTIFSFNINDSTRSWLPLAQNALRKWRTLRHPGVVRILDSVECEYYIYIATEKVQPLNWDLKTGRITEETVKWGLWSIANTLKFLNDDAAVIHGNVRAGSVFTNESGEWKLAGFEVASSVRDDEPFIYIYGGLLPDVGRFAAPEVAKSGWGVLASQPIHVTDSWCFGMLIYESFNGSITATDQLTQPKKIPQAMSAAYKRLIAANPKTRVSISDFLAQGVRSRSFFDTPLIHVSEFVENMSIKDATEREAFIDELERLGEDFPESFFKMKILPELLKTVEFAGGGPKVFDAVLRIGEKLSDDEWEASITPAVIRLFSLPDRATRVFLLNNLHRMIDHLSKQAVNNKIFPDMVTGFVDTAPIVREESVKAVLTIIQKLSERNINGELLKALAKTQNDVEPGIRTNTTICLGKIARNLGQNTRQKVLIAAFTRSLRDPFIHARKAALAALSATSDVFDETDCATKVIPAISPSLVDKEKTVRDDATKTLQAYLDRIKTLTASYPDTVLPDPTSAAVIMGTPANTGLGMGNQAVVGAAAEWTGWAISSFTKKLASAAVSGDMAAGEDVPPDRPASTPSTTAAPVRPKMVSGFGSKPASTPSLPVVKPNKPGGFLDDEDEDEEEMQGWDDEDEDDVGNDDDGKQDEFFDAQPTRHEDKSSKTVSSFGLKQSTLKKNIKEEDLDFEELAGVKKKPVGLKGLQSTKTASAGGAKKPLVVGAKKPVIGQKKPVAKKGAEWDDDWDAWG
ncbi:ARM repeat-containing protein [Ascodesmis nigricans]|uniref:ARM repeat-containing protein n=1 Tax=Ascodesmis nigricans TaxID=341454 RepID=A0A4V3SJG8_9PEZI|nr:ARM repeat-containing protein [Ascodesmis nigricans]